MNAKKNKHKHKINKPPNPQTKPENTEVTEETTVEQPIVEEKTEIVKSAERVPEIVSESTASVTEAKISEGDTPKKPKRNRGKKKKSDKEDENDDIQEQKIPEPEVKQIDDTQDSKELNIPVDEKSTDVPEIAPAARKKKNKNKKQSEPTEKTSEQEIKITPIKKEELSDVKIVTLVPVTTESSEESKSKKKNKKKKRSDSERSEKADEVAACTAAFQKLLEPRDEKKDMKKDTKAEDEGTTKKQEDSGKLVAQIIPEKEVTQQDAIVEEKTQEVKDLSKDEGGKSKKKNKKDKKQPPKMESEDLEPNPFETKTESVKAEAITDTSVDTKTKNVIETKQETVKDTEVIQKPSETSDIQKERSPKPKAKIAKPVEKKQKGKADSASDEVLIMKHPERVATPEPKIDLGNKSNEHKECTSKEQIQLVEVESNKDLLEKEIVHSDIPVDKQNIQAETKEQKTTIAKETETIPVPERDKKRKKSPKPKPADTHVKEPEIKIIQEAASLEPQPTKPSETQVTKTLPEETAPKKDNSKTICEITKEKPPASLELNEPVLHPNVPIALGFEPIKPIECKTETRILETPDVGQMPKEVVLETEGQNIQVPEVAMGKKRKKSPKLPRKGNKTPEPTEKVPEAETASKQRPKDSAVEEKVKTETVTKKAVLDLPPLEDIEIKSVKAEESEGSTCDIVPDVHYPRASSQLFDDNNNTVIRDVTDDKLNVSVELPDTPFIQGSGETPTSPPQLTPTGVQFTEVPKEPVADKKDVSFSKLEPETKVFKPNEKTDLKSKVLDVNIGMEELRKSIERSLAELTSMERSERNAEEQFASAQSKLQEITDLASKKTEGEKKTPPAKDAKIEPTSLVQTTVKAPEKHVAGSEVPQVLPVEQIKPDIKQVESTATGVETETQNIDPGPASICPARKDNKGKGKRKKGKDTEQTVAAATTSSTSESSAPTCATTSTDTKEQPQQKQEEKSGKSQEKGKQQADFVEESDPPKNVENSELTDSGPLGFEPIESFEDALTSSVDDVNKSFEIIANESNAFDQSQNPEISVTTTDDAKKAKDKKDSKDEKINPVSQPKNLLGHPDIPARLNKTDYKKEKNKTPNTKQAKVKIKDSVPIEVTKESKESQTDNKRRFLKDKTVTESISSLTSENEEYIYKYSFRKVFLPNACQVCKKNLKEMRVPCTFCSLVFYCSAKHKDEDYAQHQALCFAVSTIGHLKDQKHIYADAKNITGHEYRLLRMQMIVSCEKVLKRRLVPWEQEALLYPRICADVACREWRQSKLVDCEGCGQVSYCSDHPDHLPKSHQRWCKSYSLYHRLVGYQQTKGRLEPKLPSRVMAELYQIPEKLNEVLASMYEEKIDMTDIQYAALTQIATAPLTAAYCQQLFTNKMNSIYANGMRKKSSFTIHVVGAELQFEADALNKWEVFFLHLRPDVKELRVVLLGPDLNPSKLPLDMLGKIKMCDNCVLNNRRVLFDFQDRKSYHDYWSTDFITPDLVCAFNPSIQRSSVFNGKDTWPSTIKCILKLRVPFIITSYTMGELMKDLARVKECAEGGLNAISEPKYNSFASVRPDRNFITDDEIPLLFKNFCFAVVCGAS